MYLGGGTCKRDQEERFILEAGWGRRHPGEKLSPAIMGFIFNVTTKRAAGRGGAALRRHARLFFNSPGSDRWRWPEVLFFFESRGANAVWKKKSGSRRRILTWAHPSACRSRYKKTTKNKEEH